MNKVKALPIFVPPIALQNQFADFVQLADKSKLVIQETLEKHCPVAKTTPLRRLWCGRLSLN